MSLHLIVKTILLGSCNDIILITISQLRWLWMDFLNSMVILYSKWEMEPNSYNS